MVKGAASNLFKSTLLGLTTNDELILTAGSGTGRLADLGSSNNPSGWAGVLRMKIPASASLSYVLLDSKQ